LSNRFQFRYAALQVVWDSLRWQEYSAGVLLRIFAVHEKKGHTQPHPAGRNTFMLTHEAAGFYLLLNHIRIGRFSAALLAENRSTKAVAANFIVYPAHEA
jgi:hypothetical protein